MEKATRRGFKGSCYTDDVPQARIPIAAFDMADCGWVKPGSMGEVFLGDA